VYFSMCAVIVLVVHSACGARVTSCNSSQSVRVVFLFLPCFVPSHDCPTIISAALDYLAFFLQCCRRPMYKTGCCAVNTVRPTIRPLDGLDSVGERIRQWL
jgi:hypothetical protein